MADFKVNGITPRFGNIKVGSTNVKKIYQGSTLVWPFQDPPYFTTPTDRAETFNPDAIADGFDINRHSSIYFKSRRSI
jgi:hypothetical protein